MKTTAKDFEIFKEEFTRLQMEYGLHEWRIDFFHTEVEDGYARLTPFYVSRVASVLLSVDWSDDNEVTESGLRESAKHEACHLLGVDVYTLALARFVTQDEIMTAYETQTRRLEKLL